MSALSLVMPELKGSILQFGSCCLFGGYCLGPGMEGTAGFGGSRFCQSCHGKDHLKEQKFRVTREQSGFTQLGTSLHRLLARLPYLIEGLNDLLREVLVPAPLNTPHKHLKYLTIRFLK